MRAQPYLCYAGTELANGNRTMAYAADEIACLGWNLPMEIESQCSCDSLAMEAYVSVAADPAPWYDGTAMSEDFLGLYANINIRSVMHREVTDLGTRGATIGRLREKPRIIEVTGIMFAKSDVGMWYGRQWVEEVLSGSLCASGCSNDELELLPACDDTLFRRLLQVGVVDEPVYIEPEGQHDFSSQDFAFQFAAGIPFLYDLGTSCIDEVPMLGGASECCLIESSTWKAGSSAVIEIIAGSSTATDIHVTGAVALEGVCPEARTPTCLDITIPTLPANSRLIIDSTRNQVYWLNPITLATESGMHLLEFDGAFSWPEAPPCTDLCLCVENGGVNVITLTVDVYGKER